MALSAGEGSGGTLGALWAAAGHHVAFTFGRDAARLAQMAERAGPRARVDTPAAAVARADAVLFAPPRWVLHEAVAAAGGDRDFAGRVVVDTTNPYTEAWLPVPLPAGRTSLDVVADALPGARVVKAYNTVPSGVLAAAGRDGPTRVAVFAVGDDPAATALAAGLIRDSGFEPILLGGRAAMRFVEVDAPVYGREVPVEAGRDHARRVAAIAVDEKS